MILAQIRTKNGELWQFSGGLWVTNGKPVSSANKKIESLDIAYDPDPIGTAIKVALDIAGGGKIISRNQPDYVEGRVY